MKLATGTVVDGKIVVDGDALPEGMVVTVLAPEGDGTFVVPPELEQELDESLAQSIRGETIPVAEVLKQLRTY
jgi:multidrug efflux pump subunit AcrA (membrane-fusion protein)